MTPFDFDLFVIGGGSGGVRAARMAAQRGARVALAEALGTDGLGGTCVNVGCIPKKLYSYAAHCAEAFEESHGYGWEGAAPTLNWGTLKANRAKEIGRLNGVYANLLRGSGVTVVNGYAQLQDAHTVRVATLNADGSAGHQTLTAERLLIATGGTPHVPHFQGREHVITSNEVFDLPDFPQRLLVVGGGYIACEFASIFNGLGAQVTQLYRGEQVLRGFDDEVRHFLAGEMRKHGVDLRLNAGVVSLHREADGLHVRLEDGNRLVVDAALYATGRVPNVVGLGLEAVGVAQGAQGAIVVDEHYRTNVPSVYALGDVTARVQLTPVALGEAMKLVDHLFGPAAGQAPRGMSYDLIPTAVFTHPNVGTVGLTEAQARERFGRIQVFRSEFRALKHTLSGSPERTLMKLLVDPATDRVVGLHMVGAEAGEIVQGFAVAMKAGATKAVFDSTIGIHPTAAEEFVTMREPVTPPAP
ncbi:glutathione-disulfide reductase [Aquabacterium sp. A08]|uniref:glutathione-disulfide reductase n=1 Tax=Aquabacterium sp. A08 TaxID=2718532 RepID=UPI0014228A09|nr:glutathione-disulfide reductase [Aquabacterium sp. A08]NIC41900.1 glutathione-disulfide reductase [Aquabacterium sp. A08]NIC41911.1 glutathione-disulfide reductase [Aquabacterium sp. A08]